MSTPTSRRQARIKAAFTNFEQDPNEPNDHSKKPEKSINNACKICLDRQADIVILPCKHVAVCSQCALQIKDNCPICRGIIAEKMSIFIS